MCRERLAFGGTHPSEFQESVLQNTSFSFGVRASGHRFPCPGGTSFRDTAPGELREAVLRNASFAGETCSGARQASNANNKLTRRTNGTLL